MSKHRTLDELVRHAQELVILPNDYGKPMPEVEKAIDNIVLAIERVLDEE